jgi:hypothetical protein
MLVSVLAKAGPGLRLKEHLEHDDGEVVFRMTCARARPTAPVVPPTGSR